MGKEFELVNEIEVGATPDQAWQAIATGEGMDGWYMGRNEIEPSEGGKIRTVTPEWTAEATVTTWDPPNRLVYRTDEAEDGAFMSFDYRIEGKDKGDTSIKWIHTGMLGDNWEKEYEAMSEGDAAYFHKLGLYFTYFFGRRATPVETYGPEVHDREQAMKLFRQGLGLPGPVEVDEKVRLTPEGIEPIEGVVEWVSPSFLGVRSDDAIYRFIWAFTGPLMVAHHIFRDVDEKEEVEAWRSWMNGLVS
ncbi:MAG: SRPBCC family protein [Actinomycetota bacterium]